MFVNSVETLTSKLENFNLNITKMQPKSDRPPVCPKTKLPLFQLTPSTGNQLKSPSTDCGPYQNIENPCLLKPQHNIPSTPPPQTDRKPFDYFAQRIG